ncbi:MAG TPA: tetratricopeptide repeat protein, partial [Saprospiraceae bacterium]|nr:tetratricopeptide repeat protein [Saprospiraceae bacterium]
WERWRIPFKVEVDHIQTGLASIQRQMRGALGFDPPSLQAAAQWCLINDVNTEEALVWIHTATDPNLGGLATFAVLSTKAGLLRKVGRIQEADAAMEKALANATLLEMHGYGRQLIGQKKYQEAFAVFEKNFKKHGDAWPTHVGMMRAYSAVGDLKNALKHAKIALSQAPDDLNKRSLEGMIKTLEAGKSL